MLVANLPAGRVEDQVDEVVPVPRLVEPILGRPLPTKPGVDEDVECAFGVRLADVEVDVVVGRRAAPRLDREPAAEHELDLGLAQHRAGALHRAEQPGEVLWRRRRHGERGLPAFRVRGTPYAGIQGG